MDDKDVQPHVQSSSTRTCDITQKRTETWKEACSFVLVFGCPAAGKGTMCRQLVQDPEVLAHTKPYHLSIGDHLRELRVNGTLDPFVAQELAKQSLIDGATLMDIIEQKVAAEFSQHDARLFILDGFPRNDEQMRMFSERLAYSFGIYIASEHDVAKARFLARRDASRPQDDAALFEKRYDEFVQHNPTLIQPLQQAGLLVTSGLEASSHLSVDEAYQCLKRELKLHWVGKRLFGL